MIHQSYFNNNFDNLEISSIKPKFLTKKLFETLKTNLTVINDNINNYLQICTSQNGNNVNLIEKRNFLCFESSAENSLTLINFKKKKYFYVTENKHNGLSNKIENFIFVLNTEEDVLNHYTQNDEFIGCQVFENGKLFAGKFNNEGKINGEGIYINKKGNLICGTFQNSDIKRGKVYTKDGIIYEGTLKNLKRHGKGQTEIKKGFYEFIGDFESDKRIKGKFIYDQSNPKFKYIRNAHIDDYHKFREKNKPCLVKLRFKFKDREYFYNGFIENNKLVDENASLVYSKKGYPKFEGCLKQNRKEGKGKYHWSLEEFYSGSFLKNKFHSMSFNGGLKEFFNNPDHLKKDNNEVNLICIGQKTYSVIFDKGELLGFIELKNV